MPEKILREDPKQEQKAAEKALERDDAAEQAKRSGQTQVDYMRSLGKPGDRAKAAFRAAGIPLDRLLPEDVVAFEHRPDGTFVLQLARDLKIHVGMQALMLGTTITGVLALHEIRNLQGITAERSTETARTSGRVARLTVQDGELVLETESAALKQVNLRTEALADVAP